ncbi:MAG: YdeI/OmpD-associated family protein [Gaiellales bacterium]
MTGGEGRDLPVHSFASRTEWAKWLDREHDSSPGVWLAIARKHAGAESVSYAEALDVALCYGWIDGRKDRLDERTWLQRFTPRRARSRWSKRNSGLAEELIGRGEMAPAGMREIERARADGRWDAAYDSHSTATVPPDLLAALEHDEAARDFFAALDGNNRYAILYRIQEARRPETRARRIAKYVAMLSAGEKIHS